MRVYFAHPVETYGSLMEGRVFRLVRGFFGCVDVVNPADYSFVSHGDMEFYFGLIDGCDVVVFVCLAGFVTFGVACEVGYALGRGKDVYFLDWRVGRFRKISDLGGFDVLGFEDTGLLFDLLGRFGVGEVELVRLIDDLVRGGVVSSRVEALRRIAGEFFSGLRKPSFRFGGDFVSLDSVSRFYHWWMEDGDANVEVDVDVFREVIDGRMRDFKVGSLAALCRKLNLSSGGWGRYYFIYSGRTRRPRVSTLIRICDELGIPYYELERRGLFRGRYPCDLANPDLWRVAVHVINEDHLHRRINRLSAYM